MNLPTQGFTVPTWSLRAFATVAVVVILTAAAVADRLGFASTQKAHSAAIVRLELRDSVRDVTLQRASRRLCLMLIETTTTGGNGQLARERQACLEELAR